MNIVILGLGHIGSWLAGELSQENQVAAFDVDPGKSGNMEGLTRLARLADIRDCRPDLLINAVTLQHTVSAFEQAAPYVGKDCVICDVASVKGKTVDYYRIAPFPFVSVHPMFGPTFATMDRVGEENAVIITESCSEGRRFFETLFARIGVRVFNYSFEEHDRMMAYSLTIPFVSSMIFAACVDAKTVPGTTFTRHMALARGLLSEDDRLLAEILFNPHSVAELNKITSRLEFLKHIISARDQGEAEEFFRRLRENIGEEPLPAGSI
jgi:prephenate dehydrogenase